ncbi:MAG: pyrroline-5-carboxylate reductase [Chitinivibrionales bacterium]|nr:pyrroline-5-carboxylate reductase [Chitinivibrionales bacterium]
MNIAILGAGNIGKAIITGLVTRSTARHSVHAWDKLESARAGLPDSVVKSPPETWHDVEVILIAVKPQDMNTALQVFAQKKWSALWVSVAAGVCLASMERLLPAGSKICRVMPNTPALIGQGASAFALNDACDSNDAERISTILQTCGMAVEVPEHLIDAVTGLSGSGPAYVYLFIEALIEAGIAVGLPAATAKQLAVQTVQGAAGMVSRSSQSAADLKASVMSPGGTTVAGLKELEAHKFKFAVIEAVAAAAGRSKELGVN